MNVNQELFNKIAEVIELQPQYYNQGAWALPTLGEVHKSVEDAERAAEMLGNECGTAYCIAGWAVSLTATPEQVKTARKVAKDKGELIYEACLGRVYVNGNTYFTALCEEVCGTDDAETAGAKLLGLDEDDAEYLFGGRWKPQTGLSVPEALRKIGEGADVRDV